MGKRMRKERVEFVGYISVTLSNHEKEAFDTWVADWPRVIEALSVMLDERYKVSISFDMFTGAYSGTSFCGDPESESAGLVLSMRSSDPIKALLRVVYAHGVVGGDYLSRYDKGSGPTWSDERW